MYSWSAKKVHTKNEWCKQIFGGEKGGGGDFLLLLFFVFCFFGRRKPLTANLEILLRDQEKRFWNLFC